MKSRLVVVLVMVVGAAVVFGQSAHSISKKEFDTKVDSCIYWLRNIKLSELSDKQHIQIMMCMNTIFVKQLKGTNDSVLTYLGVDYSKGITDIYPDYSSNKGMGYYFKKLDMELGGTPSSKAVYTIIKMENEK